jgi:hypothetical protein
MRRIARPFLIILSAGAVLCVAMLATVWNYQRCMGLADSMNRMGGCTVARMDNRLAEGRPVSLKERSLALWYGAMERKYRTAAWLPLLLLVPDPPQPKS